MIIREATERDYEPLCALIDQVDRLHREHMPHIFKQADGPVRQREYILSLIGADNVCLFVAEEGDRLVGFVNVIVRLATDIPILVPRRYALIENLVVDENHRRQGIGRALIVRAHQWTVDMGAESIELTVYEFNREARAFYERLGYETESRKMSRKLDG